MQPRIHHPDDALTTLMAPVTDRSRADRAIRRRHLLYSSTSVCGLWNTECGTVCHLYYATTASHYTGRVQAASHIYLFEQ